MKERLLSCCSGGLSSLPPWLLRLLGLLSARMALWNNSAEVRVARGNLELALPDVKRSVREQLLRRSLLASHRMLLEMPSLWRMNAEQLAAQVVKQKGLKTFQRAHRYGKGVIVGIPFIGHWELMARYLALLEPKAAIVDDFPFKPLTGWAQQGRQGAGMALIPAAPEEQALGLLREGGVVGYFCDLVSIGKEGAPPPPILSPMATQLSSLARKSGALLVFAVAERLPRGGYCLHWVLGPDEIYDTETRIASEGLNRVVRLCMKRNLDQCLWGSGRLARQRLDGEAMES